MFDLEKAIASWRRTMTYNRAFTADDLDELAQHVRDQVAALRAQGLTDKEAFRRTLQEMGSYGEAEAEYRKVYWGKLRRRRHLLHELTWSVSMLRNYVTLALRNLRRRSGYAALHLTGLAVGLALCCTVLLYVNDELSFDRFHDKADQIFQLSEERLLNGNPVQLMSTQADIAEALAREVSVVQTVVQMKREAGLVRRAESTKSHEANAVVFASASFFEVFSFPLLRGDPENVLAAPGRVVLAETTARKHFGDRDPTGRLLLLERQAQGVPESEPIHLVVTGVAADPPANSTLQFDLVISGTTEVQDFAGRRPFLAHGGTTFVMTQRPDDQSALETALVALKEKHTDTFGTFVRTRATPLLALHLTYRTGKTFAGTPRYLYLFSAVALLVLLIACINYINLATAYAARRAKEVGVRKTLGASRAQLARQFMVETLLLTAMAGLLALGLVWLALPAFNSLFDKHVVFEWATDAPLLLGLLGLMGGVGVLAGGYPAFYLSRLRPVAVFKGLAVRGRGRARLRQTLVVFQFAATVALLAATIVIYEQLQFSQTRDLGFDDDQILTLDLNAPALVSRRVAIRQAMEALPGVGQAAYSSAVPGRFKMLIPVSPAGTPDDPGDDLPVHFANADPDFLATYGVRLAAGRFFTEEERAGIVLNETTARGLGLMTEEPAEALGQRIALGGEHEVIGVIQDFHFASLHEEIGAIAFQPLGEAYNGLLLSLKLKGTDLPETLAAVEQTWKQHALHYPFAYQFVDDTFDALYRADRQLGQIFGVVAGITALLACLGLLGLAAYATERRTKEIGIRKVLGASAHSLVVLLSREFAALVFLGAALSTPIVYVAMQRWLEDFAYHIELSWGTFLIAGLTALGIAMVTVSYQAIKAALADPVKSLRYE